LPNGESFENSKSIKIDRIAVIGAGTMGRGIAFAFAVEDFDVVVIEENEKVILTNSTIFLCL
jgi:3-hydroxyacyl-CoA dehydrogenase